MGKTIRKFSKKRKQTQNKRKTKGRKPIRRKSVRHGRKRGGNTEIPYKAMKPAYDVRFEVERAAKALDDTDKVKGILKKLSSDGKGSCISVNKTTIETVHRYIQDLYPNKDPEYSDAEKACELLKQKQYFKASILGQLIGLEEKDNIMKKIKEKIERKGIDENIDSETKKQAYADLIFIRTYTLILKIAKKRYEESLEQKKEYNLQKDVIDSVAKDNELQKLLNSNELQKLLNSNDLEMNNLLYLYIQYIQLIAFDLAKKNMRKVQKCDSKINSWNNGFNARVTFLPNLDGDLLTNSIRILEEERSEILDNNMRITYLIPELNLFEIYVKKDRTYGLRPIQNSGP